MFRRTSFGLLALALVAASLTAQKTLKVPTTAYLTVQAAINAANKGDTVLVAPGVFSGPIDFKGKAIHVRSSHGPERTILFAIWKPVVTFANREGLDSILEGFTIEKGTPGILIQGAGPLVTNNIIRDCYVRENIRLPRGAGVVAEGRPDAMAVLLRNVVEDNLLHCLQPNPFAQCLGGGIYCKHAVVMGNIVRRNLIRIDAGSLPYSYGRAAGGGIAAEHSLLASNVVAKNTIHAYDKGMQLMGGGGVSITSCRVVNNTIAHNTITQWTQGGQIAGSGLFVRSSTSGGDLIVNSIIRGNSPAKNQLETEIHVTLAPTYCNIEGGAKGAGNYDKPSKFVGPGDYHLRWDSPDRDAGKKGYLNLSADDFEKDERGWGGSIDVGADEFAPHVYHAGRARPGQTIVMTLTGRPNDVAVLGLAPSLAPKPIAIPGAGMLELDPNAIALVGIGRVAASGVTQWPVKLPTALPLGTIHVQALIGATLTPRHEVRVH